MMAEPNALGTEDGAVLSWENKTTYERPCRSELCVVQASLCFRRVLVLFLSLGDPIRDSISSLYIAVRHILPLPRLGATLT